MKLNFDICKICNASDKWFTNAQGFVFVCNHCGWFRFNVETYKPEKFERYYANIEDITDEEWNDIKQFEIYNGDQKWIAEHCLCSFEQLVET